MQRVAQIVSEALGQAEDVFLRSLVRTAKVINLIAEDPYFHRCVHADTNLGPFHFENLDRDSQTGKIDHADSSAVRARA